MELPFDSILITPVMCLGVLVLAFLMFGNRPKNRKGKSKSVTTSVHSVQNEGTVDEEPIASPAERPVVREIDIVYLDNLHGPTVTFFHRGTWKSMPYERFLRSSHAILAEHLLPPGISRSKAQLLSSRAAKVVHSSMAECQGRYTPEQWGWSSEERRPKKPMQAEPQGPKPAGSKEKPIEMEVIGHETWVHDGHSPRCTLERYLHYGMYEHDLTGNPLHDASPIADRWQRPVNVYVDGKFLDVVRPFKVKR